MMQFVVTLWLSGSSHDRVVLAQELLMELGGQDTQNLDRVVRVVLMRCLCGHSPILPQRTDILWRHSCLSVAVAADGEFADERGGELTTWVIQRGSATRELAARGLQVLGVDFSAVQLRRARRLVPAARFVQADMAGLEPRWDRYVPEGTGGHTLVLAEAS